MQRLCIHILNINFAVHESGLAAKPSLKYAANNEDCGCKSPKLKLCPNFGIKKQNSKGCRTNEFNVFSKFEKFVKCGEEHLDEPLYKRNPKVEHSLWTD